MEKSSILVLILSVFSMFINVIKGATQLECDSYQCLRQQIQYQCNVTGASLLIWRVINGSVTLDDVTYSTSSTLFSIPNVLSGAPAFSTILSSTSTTPQMIVSSIIFTGHTSINGYTIECDDFEGDKENCPIVIPGIPSSPDNVTIHTDTFTNSSVNISWTESPSPCVTGYRYNISSSTLEENIIMESTSNSVMVEGLVPSDDQYCVVVTAIDTANRTSNGNDQSCFIFNVPPSPVITSIISTADTVTCTSDNVTVSWRKNSYDMSSDVIVPVIVSFTVSINSLSGDYFEDSSMDLSPETTDYTFNGVQKGRNYSIKVIAKNNIGSSVAIKFHSVPNCICPLQSMLTITTMTITTQQSCSSSKLIIDQNIFTVMSSSNAITTAATTVTVSPTISYEEDITNGLSSSVSAGISVAITVPVTAVITAIITVIILYLYQSRRSFYKVKATLPQYPISTNEVEMKGNTAYGQVIAKTSTTVPTGTEYECI